MKRSTEYRIVTGIVLLGSFVILIFLLTKRLPDVDGEIVLILMVGSTYALLFLPPIVDKALIKELQEDRTNY